ncbi:MAG: hypothetical protein KC464_19700 [Myxococcales bacterium]|nr:hypothetical protein [Myxococcales bacterium]
MPRRLLLWTLVAASLFACGRRACPQAPPVPADAGPVDADWGHAESTGDDPNHDDTTGWIFERAISEATVILLRARVATGDRRFDAFLHELAADLCPDDSIARLPLDEVYPLDLIDLATGASCATLHIPERRVFGKAYPRRPAGPPLRERPAAVLADAASHALARLLYGRHELLGAPTSAPTLEARIRELRHLLCPGRTDVDLDATYPPGGLLLAERATCDGLELGASTATLEPPTPPRAGRGVWTTKDWALRQATVTLLKGRAAAGDERYDGVLHAIAAALCRDDAVRTMPLADVYPLEDLELAASADCMALDLRATSAPGKAIAEPPRPVRPATWAASEAMLWLLRGRDYLLAKRLRDPELEGALRDLHAVMCPGRDDDDLLQRYPRGTLRGIEEVTCDGLVHDPAYRWRSWDCP